MIEEIKKIIDDENRAMTDTQKYTFVYKGYNAQIKRSGEYGYLSGYIKAGEIKEKQYKELNLIAHGGITFNKNGWVGFECCHSDDLDLHKYQAIKNNDLDNIFGSIMGHRTYKDMAFVEGNIKALIDELTK